MNRRTTSRICLILLVVTVCSRAWASDDAMDVNISLHLRVGELRRAVQPEIHGNDILFTYWAPHMIRFVGIAFGKEEYSVIHPFSRNSQGVFVFALPRNTTDSEIEYRLVVDGLWMSDPTNPSYRLDAYGQKISILRVPPLDDRYDPTPRFHRDGRITFLYYGPPGRMVSLAGSFNGWDPFMYRLTETTPGPYTITLTLPPGDYYYCFVSDGLRIPDPQNPLKGFLPGGVVVSAVSVAVQSN
jgi:1,4-alpha-glucan branching enzyme